MKNKTVAIIQARMGASRLPNKMLLYLHGYPICEWVYKRVKMSKKVDQIIFALPDTVDNHTLAWYLDSIGADVYRGSENDLVDRYYRAAKITSADDIIRICADNPLICASEIDRLIDFYREDKCDYAYNHIPKGNNYPDGLGAEICTMELLNEIHIKAKSIKHREHLFNYVWDNENLFRIRTFDPPEYITYPNLKLDLDTIEDYQYLLSKNYKIDMNAKEIVNLAKEETKYTYGS